jgi:catechol 2,3-dioxygenase-like lactoylglutathione lyase family enzyme
MFDALALPPKPAKGRKGFVTAIHGTIKPTRRPGELGVHSLDRFHFSAPDLSIAKAFYDEFGLDVGEAGNQLTVKTHGAPHLWGTIGEGPRKKHGFMSFGAFEDDLERFATRLQTLGVKRLDPPTGVGSNGLWFHDHDGAMVEIKVAQKSSPNEKSGFANESAQAGARGAPFRRTVTRVHPRRLSHILMFTRDVRKAIDFYSSVLGLRLSDHSGEGIAFLHGVHGSDHHVLAFAHSNAPGFHHLSWDVGSIDDIGRGAMHMLGKGHSRGWGLGRHVLGSNYFHYVGDPWNSFCEYSADIDYVPADCDWKSGDHAPEDSFYVWGPNPPEDFTHNYEA